jgi:hypothetical protein
MAADDSRASCHPSRCPASLRSAGLLQDEVRELEPTGFMVSIHLRAGSLADGAFAASGFERPDLVDRSAVGQLFGRYPFPVGAAGQKFP